MTTDINSPVAILDKEIANYPSYAIQVFELCDRCGARFGIGYHQGCNRGSIAAPQTDELPDRLREMLREDHGHDRKHKLFTEIWSVPDPGSASDARPLRRTGL
jgi:hypothetical protein